MVKLRCGWQIWLAGGLLLLLSACGTLLRPPQTPISVHLTLGNPSNATSETGNRDNYLMVKPQYALSYNSSRGVPNWVSWQLNAEWLGKVPRRNDFRPDDSLPSDWPRIGPTDYNNSGFDRGHLTPSGDRTRTPEDNSATFLMTNILPQAPDNNQGPWNELEQYCRTLAKQGKELYILAGGYGTRRKIAEGKVVPPAQTWKVIVVLDQPGQGVPAVTRNTRVIAVDMPNRQGIRSADWQKFRVSVDEIEQKTGYDLLSTIPEAIQTALEREVDQL